MNAIEFTRYLSEVQDEQDKHPEWRLGQTFFNVLTNTHPSLAEKVRGGVIDPFFKDKVIPTFLLVITEFGEEI